MKITAVSDLHGYLPKDLSGGDILCIAGDIVPLDYQNSYESSIAWFCLDFVPWVDSVPYDKVVFVAGNHDFFLHRARIAGVRSRTPVQILKEFLPGNHKSKHSKLVYLCDNSVEIKGKRFYGTPWIADLVNWAFYAPDSELVERYKSIPKKCDVLITHMPPKMGKMGDVLQVSAYNYGASYGTDILTKAIQERDIKWTVCGHVHTGNHVPYEYSPGHFVVNASVKDENYQVEYLGYDFEI